MNRLYVFDDQAFKGMAATLGFTAETVGHVMRDASAVHAVQDTNNGTVVVAKDKTGRLPCPHVSSPADLGTLVAERMAVDLPPDRCRSAVLVVFLSSAPDHFVLWSKIAVGGDGQANTVGCREFVVATRAAAAEELLKLVAAARRKFSRTKVRVLDAAGYAAGPGCPFEAAVKLHAGEGLSYDERDLLAQAVQAVSAAVMDKLG